MWSPSPRHPLRTDNWYLQSFPNSQPIYPSIRLQEVAGFPPLETRSTIVKSTRPGTRTQGSKSTTNIYSRRWVNGVKILLDLELSSYGDKDLRRFQATCNFIIGAFRTLTVDMAARLHDGEVISPIRSTSIPQPCRSSPEMIATARSCGFPPKCFRHAVRPIAIEVQPHARKLLITKWWARAGIEPTPPSLEDRQAGLAYLV